MSICAGATYQMENLNNLFIEMTSKNCNHRCKSCFIDFSTKNIKDFIHIDKLKEYLLQIAQNEIKCIYLLGAEPMLHPDFNTILRVCLKKCNVCICTNGSMLNEKKIRFLKKVEDEGNSQIFFRLTLTHYMENLNDEARYRGSFRETMHALKILSRYNFTSVISVQNYYKLTSKEIIQNFNELLSKLMIVNTDIQINASYPVENSASVRNTASRPDCKFGRVITQNGIYTCPFLANDYRGRCGSSLNNYSKTINAETDFCLTCAQNNNEIFAIG